MRSLTLAYDTNMDIVFPNLVHISDSLLVTVVNDAQFTATFPALTLVNRTITIGSSSCLGSLGVEFNSGGLLRMGRLVVDIPPMCELSDLSFPPYLVVGTQYLPSTVMTTNNSATLAIAMYLGGTVANFEMGGGSNGDGSLAIFGSVLVAAAPSAAMGEVTLKGITNLTGGIAASLPCFDCKFEFKTALDLPLPFLLFATTSMPQWVGRDVGASSSISGTPAQVCIRSITSILGVFQSVNPANGSLYLNRELATTEAVAMCNNSGIFDPSTGHCKCWPSNQLCDGK